MCLALRVTAFSQCVVHQQLVCAMLAFCGVISVKQCLYQWYLVGSAYVPKSPGRTVMIIDSSSVSRAQTNILPGVLPATRLVCGKCFLACCPVNRLVQTLP